MRILTLLYLTLLVGANSWAQTNRSEHLRSIYDQVGHTEVYNFTQDDDLDLCVNDGGVKTCPVNIEGSTHKLSIDVNASGYALDVDNANASGDGLVVNTLNTTDTTNLLDLQANTTTRLAISSDGQFMVDTTEASGTLEHRFKNTGAGSTRLRVESTDGDARLYLGAEGGNFAGVDISSTDAGNQLIGINISKIAGGSGSTRIYMENNWSLPPTGDHYIHMTNVGHDWTFGMDGTDSAFKVSHDPALGTDTRLQITPSGAITLKDAGNNYEAIFYQGATSITSGATNDAYIRLGGTSYQWSMGMDHSDGDVFKLDYASDLNATDPHIAIETNGRVGLGKADPWDRLHVDLDENSHYGITITNNNVGSSAAAKLDLYSAGTLDSNYQYIRFRGPSSNYFSLGHIPSQNRLRFIPSVNIGDSGDWFEMYDDGTLQVGKGPIRLGQTPSSTVAAEINTFTGTIISLMHGSYHELLITNNACTSANHCIITCQMSAGSRSNDNHVQTAEGTMKVRPDGSEVYTEGYDTGSLGTFDIRKSSSFAIVRLTNTSGSLLDIDYIYTCKTIIFGSLRLNDN